MSATWVSGGRIPAALIARRIATALLSGRHEATATRTAARCERIWRHASLTLGPASSAAAVWHHLLAPCVDAMRWRAGQPRTCVVAGTRLVTATARPAGTDVLLVALPWGVSQDGWQRATGRLAVERGVNWVAVCNGRSWRWYDSTQPYARDHVGFDLTSATVDARVWHALWLAGQRAAGRAGEPDELWLDRLVREGRRDASDRTRALCDGVVTSLDALTDATRWPTDAATRQVFQWVFLLFAEARGLRPMWHPTYRRSYAMTSLLREATHSHPPPMGLQESLDAMTAVGRDGLTLGSHVVTALNGPLFATHDSSRRTRLTDARLAAVLTPLARHDYHDLGVEHLGSIYEHLMTSKAQAGPAVDRKRSGAFYTPRSLADVLVQRTLEPLVRDATSSKILSLRVVDPAMGSGALLVSALRYLVSAVETAWTREGRGGPLDVPRAEREDLPRRLAEQCLYGVDLDARAVQVARLSVWLQSMAPDRPLTWLDAHLRRGNSLIGVSPSTLLERPPVQRRSTRSDAQRHDRQLALFDLARWHHDAADIGAQYVALTSRPTETADDAHAKSESFTRIHESRTLSTWRTRADAWCGAVLDATRHPARDWHAVDASFHPRAATLPAPIATARDRWLTLAREAGAWHWPLEFPDIFDGGRGGFDAVIANPPWEMLRGDLGSREERAGRRGDIDPLLRFVRGSGLYREATGHLNTYQLFAERLLHLVRPGGRVGCLLPGSVLTDHGAAGLRRYLFTRADVDRVSITENRDALFPIHRSMRIVSMTATAGAPTNGVLVEPPAASTTRRLPALLLTRDLLRRATGDLAAMPSLRDEAELGVLRQLLENPRLGEEPWSLRFGRELNATEDRGLLHRDPSRRGFRVVDGKHLAAFAVNPPDEGPRLLEADARRVLPGEPWRRWRVAYRDVTSATNTRTLIAALLPPRCISTHTVFCLRTPASLEVQLYLCGMLNSLGADWFVRRFVGAHVTAGLIARVPIPRPPRHAPDWRRVVRLTVQLLRAPDDELAHAALQATAARLYGLSASQYDRICADFPRLPEGLRRAWRG